MAIASMRGTPIRIHLRCPSRKPLQATLYAIEWITRASEGKLRTRDDRDRLDRQHEAMWLPSIHAHAFPDGSVVRCGGTQWESHDNLASFVDSPLGGAPSFRDRVRYKLRYLLGRIMFETDEDELRREIQIADAECPYTLPPSYVVDPD